MKRSRGVEREIGGYLPRIAIASGNIDSISGWRRLSDVDGDGNWNAKKYSLENADAAEGKRERLHLLLFIKFKLKRKRLELYKR